MAPARPGFSGFRVTKVDDRTIQPYPESIRIPELPQLLLYYQKDLLTYITGPFGIRKITVSDVIYRPVPLGKQLVQRACLASLGLGDELSVCFHNVRVRVLQLKIKGRMRGRWKKFYEEEFFLGGTYCSVPKILLENFWDRAQPKNRKTEKLKTEKVWISPF
jgi:hypothetical protein